MDFINNILNSKIFQSIIIVLICFILYQLMKRISTKTIASKKTKNKLPAKHLTYIKLFNNIFKYIFLCIAILLILQINGINVSSFIAGFGIAGAIVGLALQDALKDIIMGTNILADNFFMVGDIIKYKDIEGKVLSIGLKNTKIKDIYTNDIISITNRNIDQVINVSNFLYINIPISYKENINNVESIINTACSQIKAFEYVHDAHYIGIGELSSSCIIYKIEIDCMPEFKPRVKRASLRCIKLLLDKNKIDIPYQQIDIHLKSRDNI